MGPPLPVLPEAPTRPVVTTLPVGPTLPVVLVHVPLPLVAAGMAAMNGTARTALLHVAAVFAPPGGNTDAAATPMAVVLAGIATAPIVAPMAALAAMVPIAAMDPFAAVLQYAAPSVAVLQSAQSPYMLDITESGCEVYPIPVNW